MGSAPDQKSHSAPNSLLALNKRAVSLHVAGEGRLVA